MTAIIHASTASALVVAGVPLLVRAVLSAQRAGIRRVIVVCDVDRPSVQAMLARDARTRDVEIVAADRIPPVTEPVLAIAGDWLLTPHVVRAMVAEPPTDLLVGKEGPSSPLSEGGRQGGYPVHVASTADIPRAEAALMAELRAATVDTDGPIARVDRAVSQRLSRWLVRTPLRPNHITVLGTCTGLLAAWALAQGTYRYGLAGAWLFWLAVIIDGCDGEVARLKFLESRFGQLFDVITDNLVHVALFAGLGLGAYRSGRIEEVVGFTATLIAGFLCASAATYFCLLTDGPVKHLETTTRRGRIRRGILRVFEALMNRDFAYLIVALALIDRLHWFLWGTVFGTYAYALGLVWAYRLRDGSAPAAPSAGEYAHLESRDARVGTPL